MKLTLNAIALTTLLVLLSAAQAAEIIAGSAVGDSPSPWLASVQFIKFDLTSSTPVSIKTGDPIFAAGAQTDPDRAVIVPQVGSMAWCDPSANPYDPANTDIDQCFGSAEDSQFVVLDLNKAQKKGAKKAFLRLTVKAYDDGDHNPNDADDDLVPALTVFQGRPDPNESLLWYPNKFQSDPAFSVWKLRPFTGKASNNSPGWTTAYFGQNSSNKVVLTGKLALKRGGNNYLTVAIGGDARHGNLAAKHPVNFQLNVEVDSKLLSATGGSTTSAELDKCRCIIGVTQWHASMGHCMAIAACLPIAGTVDQCKTPEMCARDGGR